MEKNKKNLIIAVISIIVIALIVVGLIFVVNMNKNYDYYLSKGQYQEAMKKASSDEEKNKVIHQNSIDYIFRKVLKDDTAELLMEQFYLKEAWCDENNNLVLGLKDSKGDNIVYMYYRYDKDEKEYIQNASAANQVNEQTVTVGSDIENSMMENAANESFAQLGIAFLRQTMAKTMQEIMKDENKVNSDCIENVNNFIKNKTTEDIELLIAK